MEKQHREEPILTLEADRLVPRAPSASGSSTHVCRSASRSDHCPMNEFHELDISELSDGSGEESEVDEQQTAANADSNNATSQQNPEHPTNTTHSSPDAGGETTEPPTLSRP